MKRRAFIIGAAGTAAAGAAIGTGAFSSVEAERTVSVALADDSQAYLEFNRGSESSDNSSQHTGREDTGKDTIKIDINSLAGGGNGTGDGANFSALSTFDALFEIRNSGSEGDDVYVWADFPEDEDDNALEDVYFYPGNDDTKRLEEGEDQLELETGDSKEIGIAVDKGEGGSTDAYDPDDDITIHANTEQPS